MCGIAGIFAPNSAHIAALGREQIGHQLGSMIAALAHRGPDDEGQWQSPCGQVALAQARLAIVDLTPAGHQPMLSACGRYALVFNGEIYNHRALRQRLQNEGHAPTWRGTGDTEVLLAAIAAWGLEAALGEASGMFALALWDGERRQMALARDRFGEKPLYFGHVTGPSGTYVAFASEMKAICRLPGFDASINPAALRHMLGHGYVPPAASIWAGMRQLSPGCVLWLGAGLDTAQQQRYFDYAQLAAQGAARPIDNHAAALAQLEGTLGAAVASQLVADVPVGVFLSGGVDSSVVAALAARASASPVKSFAIGFAEAGYDEAPHARAVAQHLGLDHHELYVTAQEALALIPRLARLYDEPFGDSSQIPTFLVSQFARQQVTVALTGDAGDEMFGGYNRHRALPKLWGRLRRCPAPLRAGLLGGAGRIGGARWNQLLAMGTGGQRQAHLGHKIQRSLQVAGGAGSLGGLYADFLDEWHGLPSPLAVQADLPPVWPIGGEGLDDAAQVMLADALSYLPGDILTKVDRATMAVSLESRVPFLDPAVVALAARMAPALRFGPDGGKQILRDLLYRLVPRALVDRPKTGFALPLGAWLQGPLRDWAEDLLSEQALGESGMLAPQPIRARWQAHLAGAGDHTQALWSVAMFQAWNRQWRASTPQTPAPQSCAKPNTPALV
jgi:asparagine synthase (glutamine-hydrolysing)